MKKFLIVFIIAVLMFSAIGCSGCTEWLFPQQSKAMTEQEQLFELKRQNKLLEDQNKLLLRIAIALENPFLSPKDVAPGEL